MADLQYPPGGPGGIGVPWETIVRKAEPHEWRMTLTAMMDDFEERGDLTPEQLERVLGVLKWMQIEGKWPDREDSDHGTMYGWRTYVLLRPPSSVISHFLFYLPGVADAWCYSDLCPILALLRGSLIITEAEYRREFASLFVEAAA